jgi:hypothetical protein
MMHLTELLITDIRKDTYILGIQSAHFAYLLFVTYCVSPVKLPHKTNVARFRGFMEQYSDILHCGTIVDPMG